MVFKTTEWKYSKEVDATQIPVTEGIQYVFIKYATYDEESDEYSLTVQSLTNEAEFTLRYWLTYVDESGAVIPSSRSRGTLISLGIALAGEPIGIPNPVDIIGGVVQANVVMSKSNAKGAQYPRVYSFNPVPEDIALVAQIDQYYLLDEGAE